MKSTQHEPRKLWNGGLYGTPYRASGSRMIERLDGMSLAAVASATGRTIMMMLSDNGHSTLHNLGKPA